MNQLDEQIFRILNSLSEVSWFASLLKVFINEYFVPVFLGLLLVYFWLAQEKRYKQVLVLAAVSVGLVNLVIKIINIFFDNPRPFEIMPANLAYYQPTDPSFPSNGAAVSFAIASAIWFSHKRLGTLAFLVAGVFSLGRVVAGVHFPSDIVAGGVLGILVSLLLWAQRAFIDWLTNFVVKLLKYFALEPLP